MTDQVPLSAGRVRIVYVPWWRGDRPADRGQLAAEVARVVEEAAVVGALVTLPAPSNRGSAEPRPMASTTSSPVSRSPSSVRTTGACPERGSSAATDDAAADLEAVLGLGRARDHVLDRAAPGGPGDEALVALARARGR